MSNKNSDICATPRDDDLNLPGSGLPLATKRLLNNNSPLDGDSQDGNAVASPLANPEINDVEDVNSESRPRSEQIFTDPRGLSRGIEASRSLIGTDIGDDDIQAAAKKSSATDLEDTDIGVADKGINTPPKNLHGSFELESDPEESEIPADTGERPRSMSDNSAGRNPSATPASCQQESKNATGQTPITINSNESDDELEGLFEDHPTIKRKREIQKLVNEIIEDWQKEIDKNVKMEHNFNVLKKRFEDMKIKDMKIKIQTEMGRINEFQQEMNEFMDLIQSFEDDLIKL